MRTILVMLPAIALTAAEPLGIFVDTRLRLEQRETETPGNEAATAVTWRVAPGWRSPVWRGLRTVIQGQAVLDPVSDYSLPDEPNGNFDIIEDPATLDFADAFVAWGHAGFEVRVGREALSLDDHRWISAEPWRQKQQTLDGAHLLYAHDGLVADYVLTLADDTTLDQRRFQRSHTARIGWGLPRWGQFAVLGQRSDLIDKPAANTDGVGLSLGNRSEDWEQFGPLYGLEYATQRPGRGATWEGDRSNVFVQAGVAYARWNQFLISYERITEDESGVGFVHPLSYDRIVSSDYIDLAAKLSLWSLIPTIGLEAQYHVYQELESGDAFAKEAKLDLTHDLSWYEPLTGMSIAGQIKSISSPADFLSEKAAQLAWSYNRAW